MDDIELEEPKVTKSNKSLDDFKSLLEIFKGIHTVGSQRRARKEITTLILSTSNVEILQSTFDNGNTLLHLLCKYNIPTAVRVLLNSFAKSESGFSIIDNKNSEGKTALHVGKLYDMISQQLTVESAMESKLPEIVKILLEDGANYNITDSNLQNPYTSMVSKEEGLLIHKQSLDEVSIRPPRKFFENFKIIKLESVDNNP